MRTTLSLGLQITDGNKGEGSGGKQVCDTSAAKGAEIHSDLP